MVVAHKIVFLSLVISVLMDYVVSTESQDTDLEPRIVEITPNVTVHEGGDVKLSCSVENLGQYRVAWIHMDSQRIISIGIHKITRSWAYEVVHEDFRTWSLLMTNVGSSESGYYKCQINTIPMKQMGVNVRVIDRIPDSGSLDKVTPPSPIDIASTTVIVPPKILVPIPVVEAGIGDNITLHCFLESSPTMNYWKREGGGYIVISDSKFQSNLVGTETHRLMMTLMIKDIGLNDFGSYRCVAKNSVGEAERTIIVHESLPSLYKRLRDASTTPNEMADLGNGESEQVTSPSLIAAGQNHRKGSSWGVALTIIFLLIFNL